MNDYLGNYGDVDPIHTSTYVARTERGIKIARVQPAPTEDGYPSEEPDQDGWQVIVCPFDQGEVEEDGPARVSERGPWSFADVGGVLENHGWDAEVMERNEPREAWPDDYRDKRDALLAVAILDYYGAYHLNAATYERDTLAEALALASEKLGVDLEGQAGVSA